MRKISRLASIVEEERNLCDEGVDQQSTPCDSDSSKKDEVAAAEHDTKIASLINTAKLLKKEKSSDWLREFKEWMDENSEKADGNSLFDNLTNGNREYVRQKKRQKPHKETSNNMCNSVHTSEGGSSSNLLESDLSFTDNAGANGSIKESSNEVNVDQDHMKMHLNSFRRPHPLELVGTSLGSGSSCCDDSSDELCSCNSEDDCIAMQAKMDLALNGHMPSFPFVDRYHEEKNGLDYFSGDKILSDHSAEDGQSCTNDRQFDIEEFMKLTRSMVN